MTKVTVQIQVVQVGTVCRLCRNRTPPRSRVYKVKVKQGGSERGYYCTFCYDELRKRAAKVIPELDSDKTKRARSRQLGQLLGLRPVRSAPNEMIDSVDENEARLTPDLLEIQVDQEHVLVTNGDLFKIFYPEGDDLQRHKNEARKFLYGQEGSQAND